MALAGLLIPAHNAARFIGSTLKSAQSQSEADLQIVIVDDGSTDATVEVVEAASHGDPRIRLVRQENVGVAGARNRALRELGSDASFVMLLDHDDVLEPTAIADLIGALRTAAGRTPAAHGVARFVDENNHPIRNGEAETLTRNRKRVFGQRVIDVPTDEPTTFATLAIQNCIWTPGMLLATRSALQAVGPFDASVAPCDDWELYVRLSRLGALVFRDKVVLNCRRHAQNQSRDHRRMAAAFQRARWKILTSKDNTPEQAVQALVAAIPFYEEWIRNTAEQAREDLRLGERHAWLQTLWSQTVLRYQLAWVRKQLKYKLSLDPALS